MPVRELTERPSIPRLGKIRLGDQGGRNNSPRNMPYFVCPPEVQAVYGEEPTELKVVFLSDDLDLIASQYYRAYNATNGLICRGDGYTADALLDVDELQRGGGELTLNAWAHGDTRGPGSKPTSNFVRQQINCAGKGYEDAAPCPMFAAKPQKCAIRNYLQFAIKDVPGLGVYQLDTGSTISTRQINGAIELARLMFGGIRGVPCTLRRVKRDVSPDGVKKGVWMVELEVDTSYSLESLFALRSGPLSRALLPPVDESEVYEHVETEAEDEALEHQHDPAFTADGAKVCRICEVVLEPPPKRPGPVTGQAAVDYGDTVEQIKAVLKDIQGSVDVAFWGKLREAIMGDYPETRGADGRFWPQRVKPENAGALLAALRQARGEPPAETQTGTYVESPEVALAGPETANKTLTERQKPSDAGQPTLLNPRGGTYT